MKTGGRQKGAQNKRSEVWENFLQYCMEGGLEKFKIELNKLQGQQYVQTYLKLLEYLKPKLTRVEETHDLTTVEELLSMTPDERKERIVYLNSKLS